MGRFGRRAWRVLVALLMAANAMGAVALCLPPEAGQSVSADSTAIDTTVTGGPTSEAVIPARMQVDRMHGVERGSLVRSLVLAATLAAAVLAHGAVRRRITRRETPSDPSVLLRTLSAPRRGPPRLQFV